MKMNSNIDKQKCAERLAYAYATREKLQQYQLIMQGIVALNNNFVNFNRLTTEFEEAKEEWKPIIARNPSTVDGLIRMSAMTMNLHKEALDKISDEISRQLIENYQIITNCINYLGE
jgi:hypothetical protein